MAIIMPIAGMCMALSVEVVRNFSTVVEACYAKAGQVAVSGQSLGMHRMHPSTGTDPDVARQS